MKSYPVLNISSMTVLELFAIFGNQTYDKKFVTCYEILRTIDHGHVEIYLFLNTFYILGAHNKYFLPLLEIFLKSHQRYPIDYCCLLCCLEKECILIKKHYERN